MTEYLELMVKRQRALDKIELAIPAPTEVQLWTIGACKYADTRTVGVFMGTTDDVTAYVDELNRVRRVESERDGYWVGLKDDDYWFEEAIVLRTVDDARGPLGYL